MLARLMLSALILATSTTLSAGAAAQAEGTPDEGQLSPDVAREVASSRAREWLAERNTGNTARLEDVLTRVTVRPVEEATDGAGGGYWVSFEAPICYTPPAVGRSDVCCGVGVRVRGDGSIGTVAGTLGVLIPLPADLATRLDELWIARFGASLTEQSQSWRVDVVDTGGPALNVQLQDDSAAVAYSVDRETGAIQELWHEHPVPP